MDTPLTPELAEVITPPNKLKEAVGNGGLDSHTINKAQTAMESSVVDFRPQALPILHTLEHAYDAASKGSIEGAAAIEAMIHPSMQLKAQGGMFKYQLVTDVCNTLVNFLETTEKIDRHVLDVVRVHIMTIRFIITTGLKGDGGKPGKDLRDALTAACNRFYKLRG